MMESSRVVFACVYLLLALPGDVGNAETPNPTARQTLESWAKAWETGSIEKLLSFYEDSKDLIAVASTGRSYRGLAEVRRMYEAAFLEATWDRVTLEKLVIQEEGDVAWGVCRFSADFTPQAAKDKLAFTSQGSFVLRKHEGAWKIALEHYSPINGVPRIQPRNL